jgi:hypothetical protein
MMRNMQLPFRWSLVTTAMVAALPAQDRHALRIAFVEADSTPTASRSAAFTAFLRERFTSVKQIPAVDLKPTAFDGVDVVLLDWDQQDGVMKWMNDEAATIVCPLGKREHWRLPTVLLGSAGLNLAVAWDVRGGSG